MMKGSHKFLGEARSEQKLGQTIAGALSGVWRQSPPNENLSPENVALITPLLYASGSAALGWWRIGKVGSEQWAVGSETYSEELLHDAYRRSLLNARIHDHELKHVLSLLRTAGIEPILVKGWAIARRYPDRALRPYGDFDFCVRPDQLAEAERALKCLESIDGHYVDLHDGFAKLDGRQPAFRVSASVGWFRAQQSPARVGSLNTCWNESFERTQQVDLDDVKVRVLSDEDHLRVLCLHLLRSGAWRPLWLCDIALAVESRGPNFDWARCLGADPLVADWVACTIGLAHQLLGAGVSGTPVAERAANLPRWLVPAVLRQWGRAKGPSETEMLLVTLVGHLTKPSALFRELRSRWDRPLVASFNLNAPLNNFPRAPYQLADMLMRAANLPEQLALMLRQQLKRFRFASFRRVAASEH